MSSKPWRSTSNSPGRGETVADDVIERELLEALVSYWDGMRYPAFHCANDLRHLLTTGRLPSDAEAERVRRGT